MARPQIARTLLALAALVGLAYWLGALARSGIAFEQLADLPKWLVIGWKGLATGLLVLSAFAAANTRPLRLLAGAVAVIWFADLWLAAGYTVLAGCIFVAAHLIAIRAYAAMPARAPRPLLAWVLQAAAVLAAAGTVATALHIGAPPLFALFPVFSALCAVFAARSTMPLLLNATGMLVFFVSDAAVVLTVGAEGARAAWGWLTWLSYFAGLCMVVAGIVRAGPRAMRAA